MFEQSHKMHNDYLLTWVYILKKTFSFQSCALKKLFDQKQAEKLKSREMKEG